MNFLTGLGISLSSLLGGAAAVIIYDLVSGYSVADFIKDLFVRVFGKAKSLLEAKKLRLEARLARIKAAL